MPPVSQFGRRRQPYGNSKDPNTEQSVPSNTPRPWPAKTMPHRNVTPDGKHDISATRRRPARSGWFWQTHNEVVVPIFAHRGSAFAPFAARMRIGIGTVVRTLQDRSKSL